MSTSRASDLFCNAAVVACLLGGGVQASLAQDGLPDGPWRLNPAASSLTFQSVKKGTVVETSKFASFQGRIGEDGEAAVDVVLESVDTAVDLRNVRMRFLFFETYKFPIASITTRLDRATFARLPADRRASRDLTYTLSLHGVEKEYTSPVTVTMIDPDTVSVASAAPVVVEVKDFGLEAGLLKLSQAVGDIDITPSASVSFDMVFDATSASPAVVAAVAATASTSGALESAGNLTREECDTRFDVLSRTEAIYFRVASARLDDERSRPLLATVVDIARRCPDLGIEVAGHTDSDGSDDANQLLSERRAKSVLDFLAREGVPAGRLTGVGYGEAQPVAGNDTVANKGRNRRIEFRPRGG